MAEAKPIKVGSRVEVIGKGIVGTVAFAGTTKFSTGKWIGVVLDEPKGKNNGTVQGKSYFSCPDNHGIFVRQSQLSVLEESSTGSSMTATPTSSKLPSAGSSEDLSKQKKQNRLSMSGLRPPSSRTGGDNAASSGPASKSKESSPAASREATPPSAKSEILKKNTE